LADRPRRSTATPSWRAPSSWFLLDATIVNVALPTIQRDLGFSEQSLSRILNAYTLVFGGFLLLSGRAADRSADAGYSWPAPMLFSGASCEDDGPQIDVGPNLRFPAAHRSSRSYRPRNRGGSKEQQA